MRIIVTGSSGQLGTDVCTALSERGHQVIPADLPAADITDEESVRSFFAANPADAVIHCAAFTAVDAAEEEKEKCSLINISGTSLISGVCEEKGMKLIYISTDYVFGGDGEEPYETGDAKAPVNHYGLTKLRGEAEALKNPRTFVVRTSWVFGLHGRNFVATMKKLLSERDSVTVVRDQVGSPTFTEDLAQLLCDMIETEKYGVYHATNEGFCSWSEFAEAIGALSGAKGKVIPILSEEYRCAAKRPLNSRLSKKSLDEGGFSRLPRWEDALRRYLEKAQ